MNSKIAFVAGFASIFFIGYALVWYGLNLVSAFSFYGNLAQALGDSRFHLAAITDTYEMATRLIMGIGLGLLIWKVRKQKQQTIA
ncbi:hypothetical protein HNV11_13055 [Spirosoma taeanense]|uniref:Uncharacterized protein n=1 Tax=Spirosoma taeanense TaxID=2735870 RepID=A0A6M5Y779_9BACT|nr:hypothetical protein [Spirosoma taeanense]QJW90238.1 hypothetical protein HNV11_13055 [Spirosoma taeanense]